jgi:hypothetical protein
MGAPETAAGQILRDGALPGNSAAIEAAVAGVDDHGGKLPA